MEDAVLLIIIAVFFAICYVAAARLGRFMEKIRRDTHEILSEEEEERESSGRSHSGYGHTTDGDFRSEEEEPWDGSAWGNGTGRCDCR